MCCASVREDAQKSLEKMRADLLQVDIARSMMDMAAKAHRLLGWQPGRSRFRHDRYDRLPYDVIVVDDDIDVMNLEDIMWAVCTRSDPIRSNTGYHVLQLIERQPEVRKLLGQVRGRGFAGATRLVDVVELRDVVVPEHREVRVGHLVDGRQVEPDLEELERVGLAGVERMAACEETMAGLVPTALPSARANSR